VLASEGPTLKDTVPHLPPVEGEPIPAWDLDRLVPRNCIVCRDPKHTPVCVRPDGLVVGQCSACGALFLPQVPNAAELEVFYRSYTLTKPYLQNQRAGRPQTPFLGTKSLVPMVRSVLRKVGVGRFLERKRTLRSSTPCEILLRTGGLNGKTVVEVGPGPGGGILPEARLWGARGIAVEVDPVASELVAGMGFTVRGSLGTIPQAVDVFVVWHVLEHLSDPGSVLMEMARCSHRGTRVLIQTPNGGQALSSGPQWIGYRVDLEHLNFFTERSLSMSLVQAGFYPECSWTESQPLLPYYLEGHGLRTPVRRVREPDRRLRPVDEDGATRSPGSFALTVLARFEGSPGI
jgi:hypothetical protein